MKKIFILFLFLLEAQQMSAQETVVLDSINFYGSLRAHVAIYDEQLEVQNNSSRIGFYINRRIVNGISSFAKLELGTNLVLNNTTFNADAATFPDESFYNETQPAFSTRLGYVGLQSKYGSLAIGKQWGVYYDVTAWTDLFWVFGGKASGTYNTDTDGGTEGTGRAENALIYRYEAERFSIGLQAQFNGEKQNYAASAVVNITNQITVGTAFNTYAPSQEILDLLDGSKTHANSFVVGFRYKTEKLNLAANYDFNQSESQFPGDTVVAFPANGVELYANYLIIPKLSTQVGLNYLMPTSTPANIDPDFNLFTVMIGAAYYFIPDFFAYTEYKIDLGTATGGNKPPNVFVIGFRYNFEFGKSQVKI
jgi:predicted porin